MTFQFKDHIPKDLTSSAVSSSVDFVMSVIVVNELNN